MKFIWILSTILQLLHVCYSEDFSIDNQLVNYDFLFGTSPRRNLNFTDLCAYDGYNCESYEVKTDDDYILTMFRLPRRSNCNGEDKLPIIFMHGLYLSGDDCIVPGPGKAHCYIYSDECYDVWVPNVRGNVYSKKHVFLNPDKNSTFWDYSFEEHAIYDLPAAIDFVLKATKKEKIIFVGHAQGASMLMVLCAKKPEYNEKVAIGFGLSTTGWLDNARFLVIKFQSVLTPFLTPAVNSVVSAEFLPRGGLTNKAAKILCGMTTLSYPFCSIFVFAVLGYNKFQITEEVLPVVVGHIPGGTSVKNFNRWGQIRNNGFTEYDYGSVENLKKYGTFQPPEYDLGSVTMKWIFLSSENDYVGDIRDIKKLTVKMPNAKMCILDDKTFGHLDFVYGKDIPNYITPKVLSAIDTGDLDC